MFLEAFGNTEELLRAEYGPLLPTMIVDLAGEPWSLAPDDALAALGLEVQRFNACAWPPRPAAPSATPSVVPSTCARPASP